MIDSTKEAATAFVKAYIALCNQYSAEVVVNTRGVHTVVFDDGKTFAFRSVCPDWEADAANEDDAYDQR